MYFYKETIAAYHQATPEVIAGTAAENQGITATKHIIPYTLRVPMKIVHCHLDLRVNQNYTPLKGNRFLISKHWFHEFHWSYQNNNIIITATHDYKKIVR